MLLNTQVLKNYLRLLSVAFGDLKLLQTRMKLALNTLSYICNISFIFSSADVQSQKDIIDGVSLSPFKEFDYSIELCKTRGIFW